MSYTYFRFIAWEVPTVTYNTTKDYKGLPTLSRGGIPARSLKQSSGYPSQTASPMPMPRYV
jgi:hypothetical protein